MNDCLCEKCDEWFEYSDKNYVEDKKTKTNVWLCDDCLPENKEENK